MNFEAITKFGGKIVLKAKKHSPEILLVAGIIGGVTATVMACKATKHVDEIVEETYDELDKVSLHVKPQKIDYLKVYGRTGLKFVKLYGPSVAVGAASIACLVGSHGILHKRYLGTAAAYAAVDEALKKYRNNVADVLGEEAEKKIFLGMEDKKDIPTTIIDEGGNEKTVMTPNGSVANPILNASPNGVWFDESNPNWTKDPEVNKIFLLGMQNVANTMFRAHGYLFLNEVYDLIGAPRTKAGQIVGWMHGRGDDVIDFGITQCYEEARSFVNGYERNIFLDFNTDGNILEYI